MKSILLKIPLILFLFACSNSINEEWLTPSSLNERITTDQLVKNGYQMVNGVDVLLYEKAVGDTLVGYQFKTKENTFEEDGVLSQYWRILKKIDSSSDIESFFEQNNLYKLINGKDDNRYIVLRSDNNAIFVCSFTKEGYLNLVYHHPDLN